MFIGMAVAMVIGLTVTYVEVVRTWKDVDHLRREVRRLEELIYIHAECMDAMRGRMDDMEWRCK